jgi:hypothetical protein
MKSEEQSKKKKNENNFKADLHYITLSNIEFILLFLQACYEEEKCINKI